MIVDGEKYACDACIRGHRVSSCTHKDRKLNHVNKKGRPLTQCPHCRGLRKSRSSHVKCECGDSGHTRTSSVESNGDPNCKCQNGRRCTCALKKEANGLNDGHRQHGTASVSKRFATKPELPGHHSDSAVPRIRVPAPPMYRAHNPPLNYSGPHIITRPRPMTEKLHMNQHSLNKVDEVRSINATHHRSSQPLPATMAHGHLSNMPDGKYPSPAPPRRPKAPTLRLESQMAMPDFSGDFDVSTMHKALSPGNPARYSFHDLSAFSMSTMSRQQTPEQNHYAAIDELRKSSSRNWQAANMHAKMDEQSNPVNAYSITPSDVSVDHSLSSYIAASSSSTMSEPEEVTAQPEDFAARDLPFRSVPPIAADDIQYGLHEKPSVIMQNWTQYYPLYAASDPGGAFIGQERMDYGGFNFEDVQASDTGHDPFFSQGMEEYEMAMPIMTDDAVRDWVSNPTQMQDPNFNAEAPVYHSVPAMEGSYGWI